MSDINANSAWLYKYENNSYWQLKEIISGVAKNGNYNLQRLTLNIAPLLLT